MHGIIYKSFKDYVQNRYGREGWDDLREAAGVERTVYMSTRRYEDDELVALLEAAAERSGDSVQGVLESFGESAAGDVLGMYKAKIDDDWGALDVVAHAEDAIRDVISIKDPNVAPPGLETEWTDDDTVHIHYTSNRQLCGLVKGIVQGIARDYGQRLRVNESRCMLNGAGACEIDVSRI